MEVKVPAANKIKGEIKVPGDKSITHRAFIFSLIAKGETIIKNYSSAADCASTLRVVQSCGGKIARKNTRQIRMRSKGIFSIEEPKNVLNAGNSGTTMRLMSGLFTGVKGKFFVFTGDDSLRSRPMKRITEPLSQMGAEIRARSNGDYAPIAIHGKKLRGIKHEMKVASAQVKSAIILAALSACGETEIIEKEITRNHTEIMLKEFGGKIRINSNKIFVYPLQYAPSGREIFVPNDFSSAAYFIGAALITDKSSIILKDVGVNRTRSYFIDKLQSAGANITLKNQHILNGEEIADIIVESSHIKGVSVSQYEAPLLIDELPLIAAIGAKADGVTVVEGAEELRYKETDRITAVCKNLHKLGIQCEEKPDGFIIYGKKDIRGGEVESFSDHRIAMSFAVLALATKNGINIKNAESVSISFPQFFKLLFEAANG